MPPDVELEPAGAADPSRRLRPIEVASPQDRADTCDELRHREGLEDVIVGACLEPDDPVDLSRSGGQHQDRQDALRAQPSAHLQPGQVGQHQVEDHQVVRLGARAVERSLAGVDPVRIEPLAVQRVDDGVRACFLILDEEDSHAHDFAAGSSTRARVPWPGSELRVSLPPIVSSACDAIEIPSPNPPPSRPPPLAKRRCSRSSCSGVRPPPVSTTLMATTPLLRSSTEIATDPSPECRCAFVSRFVSACSARSRSTKTDTPGGQWTSTLPPSAS